MRLLTLRLLTLLVFATLGTALNAEASPAPTVPDVEVLRPAPGEVLIAGGEAVVAWRSRGALDPRIEEWEAFLSFNGGDYFAVRITPHLDLSHQRFVFQVPDVPTDDARILLRFGDERREVEVEVPHGFVIRPASSAVVEHGRIVHGRARGEAARPGEPGVVAWVEGTRDGTDLEYVTVAPSEPGAVPVMAPGRNEQLAALADRLAEGVLQRQPAALTAPRSSPPSRARDSNLSPTSILLLNCRQNE